MDPAESADLYEKERLRSLFDDMAATYDRVSLLTSFGFSRRWRRQAVAALDVRDGDVVLDAMTGMGEGWEWLGRASRVIALDLSPGMLAHAAARQRGMPGLPVKLIEGDATAMPIPDASIDRAVCLFGLKTLSEGQEAAFAAEIARVLRPTGRCSVIEVSLPPNRLLRLGYLLWLGRVVPLVGRLLLGDPTTYRMLAVYTRRFGNSERAVRVFRDAGLAVRPVDRTWGCATGFVADKLPSVADRSPAGAWSGGGSPP